jgi:hypothetical protein
MKNTTLDINYNKGSKGHYPADQDVSMDINELGPHLIIDEKMRRRTSTGV